MTSPLNARLVPLSLLAKSAWANGTGYTKEIGVGFDRGKGFFVNAGSTEYQWRLSLAELTRPADFSLLPGIDRVFTLASPGPVVMTVGREERTLQQGQKIAFAGETAVTVKVASDEPQLGLNLMTRRGMCHGNVITAVRHGRVLLNPGVGIVAATVLTGTATLNGEKVAALTTILLGTSPEEIHTESCLMAVVSVSTPPF
ncbi:HutD family protein [Arthrobacter sp. 4R501]|uniref:HutD family protein n=1 Tax=Arthrobacter sp. 4R501 TaxID=2058886 RepID=UPI000CE4FCE3|nr:HutD family protein [Arthrobacter sp. 4R501]